MLPAIFLNPSVPIIQEHMLRQQEFKIILHRFRHPALLERRIAHPYFNRRIVLRNAVLQKEKVHISLEVHKQIEKCFIAFYYL